MPNNSITRIELSVITLSPLSHIGKSISADNFLRTVPMRQSDGTYRSIFSYSGNALRGMFRDFMAEYILSSLNIEYESIPLESFDFIFSSGVIGGQSKFDPNRIKLMKNIYPPFGLLGGNLNNMMMQGKTSFSDIVPVCKETEHNLNLLNYAHVNNEDYAHSYYDLISELEYTRSDDSKSNNINTSPYLKPLEKERKSAVQMRYKDEILNEGVLLKGEILLNKETPFELGALFSAFHHLKTLPFIGGMKSKGFGKVQLEAHIGNKLIFSTNPSNQTDEYFKSVLSDYDKHLLAHKGEIISEFTA